MSPEELYTKHEHYAKVTLAKLVPEAKMVANTMNLDYDDLLQYAKMGLWKACTTYKGEKLQYKFTSFAIRNIRWYLLKSMQKAKSKNTDRNMSFILSLNNSVDSNEEDLILEDVCYSDNINKFECETPENKLLSKVGKNEILNILDAKELKLINLRLNEYLTYQQIADRYGLTRQAIGAKFTKIQKKINRRLGVLM